MYVGYILMKNYAKRSKALSPVAPTKIKSTCSCSGIVLNKMSRISQPDVTTLISADQRLCTLPYSRHQVLGPNLNLQTASIRMFSDLGASLMMGDGCLAWLRTAD